MNKESIYLDTSVPSAYFDYYKIASEMGIAQDIIIKVEKDVKKEFPDDKMMYELHVLRALKSRYWEKAS